MLPVASRTRSRHGPVGGPAISVRDRRRRRGGASRRRPPPLLIIDSDVDEDYDEVTETDATGEAADTGNNSSPCQIENAGKVEYRTLYNEKAAVNVVEEAAAEVDTGSNEEAAAQSSSREIAAPPDAVPTGAAESKVSYKNFSSEDTLEERVNEENRSSSASGSYSPTRRAVLVETSHSDEVSAKNNTMSSSEELFRSSSDGSTEIIQQKQRINVRHGLTPAMARRGSVGGAPRKVWSRRASFAAVKDEVSSNGDSNSSSEHYKHKHKHSFRFRRAYCAGRIRKGRAKRVTFADDVKMEEQSSDCESDDAMEELKKVAKYSKKFKHNQASSSRATAAGRDYYVARRTRSKSVCGNKKPPPRVSYDKFLKDSDSDSSDSDDDDDDDEEEEEEEIDDEESSSSTENNYTSEESFEEEEKKSKLRKFQKKRKMEKKKNKESQWKYEKKNNQNKSEKLHISKKRKIQKQAVEIAPQNQKKEKEKFIYVDDHSDASNWSSSDKEQENPQVCFFKNTEKEPKKEVEVEDDAFGDNAEFEKNEVFEEKDEEILQKPETENEAKPMQSNVEKKKAKLKPDEVLDILTDTILDNQQELLQELEQEPTLKSELAAGNPLIFSFSEKPEPKQKTDYEMAIDDLWDQFEFAIGAENLGSYQPNEDEIQDVNEVTKSGHSHMCSSGKHSYILDEKIGIVCKFCKHIQEHIKYVVAPFGNRVRESSAKIATLRLEEQFCVFDPSLLGQAKQYISRPPDGTVWDLIPGVHRRMTDYQQDGFEFMWRNLGGSIYINELKSGVNADATGGCVISHAPGTGKTMLAIMFVNSFMKMYPDIRPVILAPSALLSTWDKQFKQWEVDVPFHVMNDTNYSGKEDPAAIRLVGKDHRSKTRRVVKLYTWARGSGILGVSYGLYVKLTQEDSKHTKTSTILLEKPGLFVLDEGHTPRNEGSLIWKALQKVKTGKRIILSGTPFQNNFVELYNTLSLVRPKFAEKISAKTNRKRKAGIVSDSGQGEIQQKDELKGKWVTFTQNITDDNLETLKETIKPFVHVYHGKILDFLPGLRDCVIILDPLPRQKAILDNINITNNFEHEYRVTLASIHPSLMTECELSKEEESFFDKDELDRMRRNPNEGVKTKFVIELCRLCEIKQERVLVFSQFINPLKLIIEQLGEVFRWNLDKEILLLEGKMRTKIRDHVMDRFNDLTSNARVLLASTKACSEGICLTGASRLVLLDVVWNPSVETQAVSRAYRIGQKKVVYAYHLISGKQERARYNKQTRKGDISKLVFSKGSVTSATKNKSGSSANQQAMNDEILEEMTAHSKLKDMFVEIDYRSRES